MRRDIRTRAHLDQNLLATYMSSEDAALQLNFFHGDIRDSRKYDTFRGKHAVLFINLLGKGLTQEINGDGGSI